MFTFKFTANPRIFLQVTNCPTERGAIYGEPSTCPHWIIAQFLQPIFPGSFWILIHPYKHICSPSQFHVICKLNKPIFFLHPCINEYTEQNQIQDKSLRIYTKYSPILIVNHKQLVSVWFSNQFCILPIVYSSWPHSTSPFTWILNVTGPKFH